MISYTQLGLNQSHLYYEANVNKPLSCLVPFNTVAYSYCVIRVCFLVDGSELGEITHFI